MARRKRDPYYHRGEPGPWPKVFKAAAILLAMAAVLAIGWCLTLFQPRKIKWDDPNLLPPGDIPAQYSQLLDQSMLLEKNFKDAERVQKITADDLLNLRQAIELQREYLYRTHNHNLAEGTARIDTLTATLETYQAEPLRDQSMALQAKGESLEKNTDYAGAQKCYDQAAQLEDQILHDDVKSKLFDTAQQRSLSLHHQADYVTALPLNDQSQAAEAAARDAVTRQDWDAAQKNFTLARDLQQRLNHDFANLSFNNNGRLESLIREVDALRSLPEHDVVAKSLQQARTADTAGDYANAANYYQDAKRQEVNLIKNFPDSRFADPAQVDAIEVERQTSLSRPLAAEILAQAAAVFDDLRHRRIQPAQDNIRVLAEKAAHFHETYPRSTLLGDDLRKRIDYLSFKSGAFGAIQDEVYGLLLPVPGQTHLQMAKEEVSQSLYTRVVGGNPSRNAGPTLPVESVSWLDAQEFCQRLSWILARPVSLPTVDEYQAALGSADSVDLATMTWNLDNSGGHTQTVATKAANANGYYDLLGNVAEWLDRPLSMDTDVAPVFGGSVQTGSDALRTVSMRTLTPDSRNAYTGFRFVANNDDSLPVMPPVPTAPAATASTIAAPPQ